MYRDTLKLQKLKEEIAQDRVVIIAGTGVSIAACGNQKVEGHSVASWAGLLQHGLAYCQSLGLADEGDAQLLGMQIASGKSNLVIAAAEEISQRLQSRAPGVFRGWLKDTVGALAPHHREILDALAALPGILATLNYDGLIERATAKRASHGRARMRYRKFSGASLRMWSCTSTGISLNRTPWC